MLGSMHSNFSSAVCVASLDLPEADELTKRLHAYAAADVIAPSGITEGLNLCFIALDKTVMKLIHAAACSYRNSRSATQMDCHSWTQ